MAYKKLLSGAELAAIAAEHKESAVFRTNRSGSTALEPWLKTYRFGQALQIAQAILDRPISARVFRECWNRTRAPRPTPAPSEISNTATFGGYRLGRRTALNRAAREQPRKKKK